MLRVCGVCGKSFKSYEVMEMGEIFICQECWLRKFSFWFSVDVFNKNRKEKLVNNGEGNY